MPMRVPFVVVGVFRTASGLGESARLHHDAIRRRYPVYGVDVTHGLMQPTDLRPFDYVDLPADLREGTVILHVNAPLVPMALALIGRARLRHKRIIGYWAWELPAVPEDWRHGFRCVDEIWVPSAFTANALRAFVTCPVHVVHYPMTLPEPAPSRASECFTVLTIFNMASSFARKNPLAAIDAFRRAFGDDPTTRLIVKYTNGGSYPLGVHLLEEASAGTSNITLDGETRSSADIAELYGTSDVVISLHRSEGFGLTIAEAMCHGVPVIATNWSGNVDFFNAESGMPIGFHLVPARDPQGTYDFPEMTWAEPNIDEAAAALRRLRSDPSLRRRLATTARAVVHRHLSVHAYERQLALRLRDG